MKIRMINYDFPTPLGECFTMDYYNAEAFTYIGMHQHNCDEILLVRRGTLRNELMSGTTEHEGPCILWNREYEPHQAISAQGKPYERLNVRFSRKMLPGMEDAKLLGMGSFLYPLASEAEETQILFRYADLFREEYLHVALCPERVKKLSSLLVSLIAKVYEISCNHAVESTTPSTLYIRDVIFYMEAHYAQRITTEDLVSRFFVGKTKLSDDFRQVTGCSINAYLTEVRLRHAKEALLEGQTISSIAFECGFSSESHFASVFKRVTGITPTEFRRTGEHYSALGKPFPFREKEILPGIEKDT